MWEKVNEQSIEVGVDGGLLFKKLRGTRRIEKSVGTDRRWGRRRDERRNKRRY